MKSLKRILSIFILITLVVSCSPEKVAESQIKINRETGLYDYKSEPFTGIGIPGKGGKTYTYKNGKRVNE